MHYEKPILNLKSVSKCILEIVKILTALLDGIHFLNIKIICLHVTDFSNLNGI